jgi:hypothetical protein
LRNFKKRLEAALTQLQSKEKDEGHKYMANNKLLPTDLSDIADAQYKKLFDNGDWPPAKNLHDSKAPPKHFGNLNQADSTDKDKSKDTCNTPSWSLEPRLFDEKETKYQCWQPKQSTQRKQPQPKAKQPKWQQEAT